jgi:hypothetical protein
VEEIGARDNERVRHVFTSYRELSTYVLHTLAPDEDIRAWTSDPKDYANARPTRATRVKFIYSKVGNAKLKDFYKMDVEARTTVFELLNPGTHTPAPPFTNEDEIRTTIRKVEGFLLSVVEMKRSWT